MSASGHFGACCGLKLQHFNSNMIQSTCTIFGGYLAINFGRSFLVLVSPNAIVDIFGLTCLGHFVVYPTLSHFILFVWQ